MLARSLRPEAQARHLDAVVFLLEALPPLLLLAAVVVRLLTAYRIRLFGTPLGIRCRQRSVPFWLLDGRRLPLVFGR